MAERNAIRVDIKGNSRVVYKIRHKPTGLYTVPGRTIHNGIRPTVSPYGKIYRNKGQAEYARRLLKHIRINKGEPLQPANIDDFEVVEVEI